MAASGRRSAEQRALRRVRTRIAVVATFAVLTALIVADWNLHYKLWPTPTPFPAIYGGSAASADFRSDGRVIAHELPVWGGARCTEHPALVSGSGHWYQAGDGHMWIDVNGRLVKWGPDTQFWSVNWDKIVLPYCEEYGVSTAMVLGRS